MVHAYTYIYLQNVSTVNKTKILMLWQLPQLESLKPNNLKTCLFSSFSFAITYATYFEKCQSRLVRFQKA